MILNALSSLGFPAAICLYLLMRVNKTLENLTNAINNLNKDVEKHEEEQSRRLERLEEDVKELKFKVGDHK
ncbi:MAG: YvrJ family protein [Selenomonadaceae bacterium]|nr:YvrJ family protein [Selenomonadaceae bacterium]